MPSSYPAIDCKVDNDNGTTSPAPSATVKVWNVTGNVDLGVTLTADSNGIIPAGTLNVAVGTKVRFRVENFSGRSGYAEITTT